MKAKDDGINAIRYNRDLITSKPDIAKSLKDHFETCAVKLAEEVPDGGVCEILVDQQQEWGLEEINIEELKKIFDSLLPKSSCGFDLLSNRMLKKEKKTHL